MSSEINEPSELDIRIEKAEKELLNKSNDIVKKPNKKKASKT